MAALELKGIPALPTTLFLVSALSAVAYRHMVVALLESICLQLPVLLAQNGTTSTCIASGSAILICLAVARYSNESYDLMVYMKVIGPGHALLLIGKLLQRPKMPSFADITAPSVSWMLVDMLTWTAKPVSASSTNSAHSDSAEEDCRSMQCTLGTGTDRAALESPTGQQQHASELQQTAESSSHRSRVSRGPRSAGQQQKLSERTARNGTRRVCKVERRMAGDVHIVRPSALRRSASCPEEAAQPGAASALRSHSLSPEAWEDMHGGIPSPSFQLRSHSLELPSSSPDVEDVIIASHRILLEDSFGSCGDLASMGASGAAEVVMESDADSAASGWRSPSCSVDGATFHDALDVQVNDFVGSLGMDGECPPAVRAACPEAFLLQFCAILNEPSAIEALRERGLPSAWGGEGACFGAPDPEHANSGVPWEPICEDSSPGVSYSAWRRPLRCGLFLYRTTAVIEGVAPADVRRFHLDDEARGDWDESLLELERFPGGGLRENCMVAYRAKWPRPFSPRDYLYGRRVWSRPADGGCYCVSAAANAAAAAPAPAGGHAVRVRDFASCLLIRSAPGCPGATEVTTVYFENPCVRPSFINLAVRKGLWPYLLKYVAALREHSAPASTTFAVQSEPERDQQPQRERAGQGSRSRASGRRRSLVRRQTRPQPTNLIRRTVGHFMRRNFLLTATILAVLF